MITNAEIKRIRSLREKKFRDSLGLFTVEGEKMVAEALKSGFRVESVWRRDEIGDEAMGRISALSSPSPVLAVVAQRPQEKFEAAKGLYLGLDSVRDPGNLGTILRIADWFGVDAVLASPDCVETYNPKVIQASMGSIFRVKVYTADIAAACDEFARKGLPVWGTFLDGKDIYASRLGEDGLVVMGNEADGISPEVSGRITNRLLIPSFAGSGAESLNVAVATAITLSEFRRR